MPVDTPQLLQLTTVALLVLPFAGFLILTGLHRRVSGVVATLLTATGFLLAVLLAFTLPQQGLFMQTNWSTVSGVSFPISFRVDALAAMMLVLVYFVALLVQLYSIAYLHDEPKLGRYFGYLQLFIGAMLGIVLAGNLLVMYAFWELVGLASYLLIGFYAERPAAAKAAQKAFLMNRVGDIGFLVGIFLTYYCFDTLDFGVLTAKSAPFIAPTALGLCLFMGCAGKSAQFPLLTWLPDAMEGPTPVSALLHAATMVAAGIFLLARIQPLLSPDALLIVALVGIVTTIWGGYSALFQVDIKKVLAFSTVSQLGLMVVAVGTGNVPGALFHLLTHAFFKAGLFLSAGAIIHAVHTQDMRLMGGLRRLLPVTFWGYTACAAALTGLPFFSGFLSKETILNGAFGWADAQTSYLAYLIPITVLLSSALTALYMARQCRLVFFGPYRNQDIPQSEAHEPSWLMRGPVVLLATLSVGVWFSLNPLAADGSWFFRIFPVAETAHNWWLAPVSIGLVLVGGWAGFNMKEPRADARFVQLSLQYGYLDVFYRHLVIRPTRRMAALLSRADHWVVDGVVDGLGISTVVLAHVTRAVDKLGVDGLINGVVWLVRSLSRLMRSVQNGRVQSYITVAVVGLLVVLWWIL